MTAGEVTADRQAVIGLRVIGPAGEEEHVVAVLDTGFTDFLSLPPDVIARLGFEYRGSSDFILGDGSEVGFEVFYATIEWEGRHQRVYALAADGDALVGMSLLYGSRLTMDVVDGGSVTIEAL